MTVGASETSLEALSEQELQALLEAAAWYARYHHRMIAEQADDPSALAETRRERFRDLHAGLRKLGIALREPDGLRRSA
ncbi:MAG: hypothetical protein IT201_07440 [Thermoleophilia bacterium]|nr:hypothetical protein [Thermoleophilia bacterium]